MQADEVCKHVNAKKGEDKEGTTVAKGMFPKSPFQPGALHGGLPAAINRTPVSGSGNAHYSGTPGVGAKVNAASVLEAAKSLGRMLDLTDLQYDPTNHMIGKGAMGVLYKASLQVGAGSREVAVKQMLPCEGKGQGITLMQQLESCLCEIDMGLKVSLKSCPYQRRRACLHHCTHLHVFTGSKVASS